METETEGITWVSPDYFHIHSPAVIIIISDKTSYKQLQQKTIHGLNNSE